MSAAHVPSPMLLQHSAVRFQADMGPIVARYLAGFDLLGRLHVMLAMKKKTGDVPRLNTMSAAAFDEGVFGFERVPSQGAIDYLRRLTGMTTAAFDGLAARYRLLAFTISGVSDVRLIEQIKSALADTLANGGTVDDFRSVVNALFDRAGIERLAQTQLDTVFQTNIMKAYAKGRAEQLADPDVLAALPYWQYRTAGDSRVRPAHAALDGFTARQDDFVWGRIYPPCGFNCRCTVIPLLASEAPDGSDAPGSSRIPMAASSVPDPGFGGFTNL